jgi:hypothetical protein
MSRWSHDHAECPPDPADATVADGEHRTVQNLAAELQRDLPGDWRVTEYVYMDPRKKNHAGGAVLEALTVEHPDGVTLTANPYSSFPNESGPTIYNGHVLSREYEGEPSTEIRRGAGPGGLGTLTGVHEAVVEVAREHVERRGRWFHSDDDSDNESETSGGGDPGEVEEVA